ncbi:hypothetical protein [Nocardioides litoris]|uniref:hypothetical protein n=1 Tax=Nocardioides litoris TaxID=1926648 RepID=UPI001120C260|nr:hypothetical protein [Nocardioides litoris]
MSDRSTVIRSLHDAGLAAWFGGSLMGATGLNHAAGQAHDPAERTRLSALGWKSWAPFQAGAIAAHGIGGAGLIVANRRRVQQHGGAALNTWTKGALTVVAAGLTAYSGVLGKVVEAHQDEGAEGATEPSAEASTALATAQRNLKVTQWAIPALTGILVVMGAQQGEQQRPGQQLVGRLPAALGGHR